MASQYQPCPKCGSTTAQPIGFTWWGGALGPRLMSHVKCQNCGAAYNGKSGNYNTLYIAIYFVIALILVMAVTFALNM